MTFEDAIKLVPDEWTAWTLETRRRKSRFVFHMTRLSEDHEHDVESDYGHGATPAEAVLNAISKLPAAPPPA